MRLTITREKWDLAWKDVRDSNALTCTHCIIARVFRDAGYKNVEVGTRFVFYIDAMGLSWRMTDNLVQLRQDFDGNREPSLPLPYTFEVDIPAPVGVVEEPS